MTTAKLRIREFPHDLTAENIANFVGRSPLREGLTKLYEWVESKVKENRE